MDKRPVATDNLRERELTEAELALVSGGDKEENKQQAAAVKAFQQMLQEIAGP